MQLVLVQRDILEKNPAGTLRWRRRVCAVGVVLLAALVIAGCGTPPLAPVVDRSVGSREYSGVRRVDEGRPASYRVRGGDTLYAIAWRYGLDYRQLAQWNNIGAPYTIYPRQELRLRPRPASERRVAVRAAPDPEPVKTRPAPVKSTPAASSKPPAVTSSPTPAKPTPRKPEPKPAQKPPPKPANPASSSRPSNNSGSSVSGRGAVRFGWPADGPVLSSFAAGDPTRNGIDIAGSAGQRVNAAAAGQVVYSGTGLVGYGELIIVKHNDEWLSAYGHNRKRIVGEGDMVTAGQQIAELGDSGTNRAKLHFEIRRNGKPVDPQRYLPKK